MPLTVSQLMEKMPGAFLPEKAQGVNATVHFKFTGVEGGEWNASIADGKCEVTQGAPSGAATMTLTADSSDYVKLFTGELDGVQECIKGCELFVGHGLAPVRFAALLPRKGTTRSAAPE